MPTDQNADIGLCQDDSHGWLDKIRSVATEHTVHRILKSFAIDQCRTWGSPHRGARLKQISRIDSGSAVTTNGTGNRDCT